MYIIYIQGLQAICMYLFFTYIQYIEWKRGENKWFFPTNNDTYI
jgi:hypothetical protein